MPVQRSLIGCVTGTSAGRERKSEYAAAKATASRCSGNHAEIRKLIPYEDGQGNPAAGSYRRAGRGEHGRRAYVANEMRTLAQAFRTQAEIIKKKKKKKKK